MGYSSGFVHGAPHGSRLISERDDELASVEGPETLPAATPEPPAPAPSARTLVEFAWTPELAAGRAPGSTPPSEAPRNRRWLDWLVWIVGVAFAIGLSTSIVRAAYDVSDVSDPRNTGRIFGTLAAAFLIAFVAWAIVVWISRRRGTRRRRISPMIPLLAIVVLLLRLADASAAPAGETALAPSPSITSPTSTPSATATPTPTPTPTERSSAGPSGSGSSPSAAPRPSVDPAVHARMLRMLVIDPPYSLGTSPPDEEREFLGFFSGDEFGIIREVAVRRVLDGQGVVGFVVVADIAIDPALEALSLAGLEIGIRGEGGTATRDTIGGRTVLTGASGGAAFVMWVEAPSMKIVYGFDAASARAIAQAFLVPK